MMDVKEQTLKLDKARDRYREAEQELKTSHEKDLEQMKNIYETKSAKQSKGYAAQKTKLEEQNQVSNELYSKKTKETIDRSQEDFKNRLRDNTVRFEQERSKSKNELNDKLSSLSESYKKSFDENDRYEDQIKKSMGERYDKANKTYQSEFNEQVNNLEAKAELGNLKNRKEDREERIELEKKHTQELENLSSTTSEQKFKEISRLRDDTENLRTTMARDNQFLKNEQAGRVGELLKIKAKESEAGQRNFTDLQENIRHQNSVEQERQNAFHKKEAKELEKKFSEDIRNIQNVSNQKIQGGNIADNLQEELGRNQTAYKKRLEGARDEIGRLSGLNSEKELNIDNSYRDQIKMMKASGVERLAKKEMEASDTLNKTVKESREKNNLLVDKYKNETTNLKNESQDELGRVAEKNKHRIKEQRVEFGRIVNSMNDKSMETINSLKEEYSKDKTNFAEKSKRDMNDEKVAIKNEFNKEIGVRETLYEQKLAEIEKQATNIIENYERRISQIARKAEKEVESIKDGEAERKLKESRANKSTIEALQKNNQIELSKMRDKYEHIIARDRTMDEQQANKIVQKYQDQLERERAEHQKESTTKLGEARAQYERLYEGSEIEKEAIRSQYEQRIENLRLASLGKTDSKKV